MDRLDADMPAEDFYLTLDREGSSDLRVKRSRFLGFAAPTAQEKTARAFVHTMEQRYHDARHVCFAWRLRTGDKVMEFRSDAGEPSGSAGEPILGALRKVDVAGAVAVVVRYFGGVKLGTGGLGRAYAEAAEIAVAASGVRIVPLGRLFDLNFPYPLRKTVDHLLQQASGEIRTETYGADINWRVWLPHSRCASFGTRLVESTAGSVQPTPVPDSGD